MKGRKRLRKKHPEFFRQTPKGWLVNEEGNIIVMMGMNDTVWGSKTSEKQYKAGIKKISDHMRSKGIKCT